MVFELDSAPSTAGYSLPRGMILMMMELENNYYDDDDNDVRCYGARK
jgi:hypothetical protein